MDYKELMCGDWVKVEQVTEVVNAKVLGVYKDGINYEVDYSGVRATNQIHIDYVSPVKLTEEILVKNGFEKQEDVNEWSYYKTKDGKGQYMILWSMDYNYLEIGSYTDEFGEFNRMGTMRYVHQLQQALRLCGIEKELTI